MRTIITTFEEVKAKGKRYEVMNGKKVLRQKTFTQTVNPYNKNLDGTVKSRYEVIQAVQEEARKWSAE